MINTDSAKDIEKLEMEAKLKGSLLLFIQAFFPLLTGREFILSNPDGRESHFITVCRALTKCTRLESLRLIINVPPGHGKSVMVSFWVAWCLAKFPDSNFLYISYSKTLAAKHTDTIKRIMMLKEYKELFDVHLRDDSQAKDAFKTTAGGSVAAFGAQGSITGQDAGLPGLERFSGGVLCFPYDEFVQTENGPIKIGDIVENKLKINVYSVDLKTKKIQLKPIVDYYKNPASPIIEIICSDGAKLKCTPNHKIWTTNRGWVEAQNLSFFDNLFPPITYSMAIYAQFLSYLNSSFTSISNKSQLFISQCTKFFNSSVWPDTMCKICPSFSAPNLVNGSRVNSKIFGNIFRSFTIQAAITNFNNFISIQLRPRSIFPSRKRSMLFSILHVIRFRSITKIIKPIVSTISINMPYFNTALLRANESPRHKSMDKKIFNFAVFAKRYPMVSSTASYLGTCFQNLFFNHITFRLPRIFPSSFLDNSPFTAHTSKIRDAIKTFISRNRTPVFIRHIDHVDKTYCINVEGNHNFFSGLCKPLLVSNCDDMHKPDEVGSDLVRESVITNFRETIQQRPRGINVPIVFIGQRLHEQDLPAFLLSGEDGYDWDNVVLKSIDEAGNALYPEAFPLEMLKIRQDKDRYVFAAQHQQDPQPAGGGLYTPEDFPLLENEPEFIATFITADTAETEDMRNDASAFSFWGLYEIETMGRKTGIYAVHWIKCREMRVEPKKLEGEFLDFWQDCVRHHMPPQTAYIEKKSTGVTLISILKNMRGLKIREIERTRKSGSKSQRFIDIQPYIANKQLSLPKYGEHTKMCVDHMKKITNNDSHAFDDIADNASDAIRIALIDKILYGCNYSNNNVSKSARIAAHQLNKINELKRRAHRQRT